MKFLRVRADSDTSRGSTVTRSGLVRVAESIESELRVTMKSKKTKAECISSMLEVLGGESDGDDVSRGGTITAYALYKIYKGLSKRLQV